MEQFIPVSEPYVAKNQLNYVANCIKTNWISSLGEYIRKFETGFSKFIGTSYGVSTSNGTTALHLALEALKIGSGDEVIVPDFTFVATANAVTYAGANPVFVDVNENDWCMNPGLLEEKITSRTKAIIPVHVYGNLCGMDEIMEIAKEHNLLVIEDVAEATGAEYSGSKAGSIGDISCFSFYGNKVITTGEGGMCLTNSKEIKERMELLKDQGMSKTQKYYHPIRGFNYRMTNLQAAIGLAQLEDINFILERRRHIADAYSRFLKCIKGIKLAVPNKHAKEICWLFSCVIDEKYPLSRDNLIDHLAKNKIDSRPFFHPMHKLPFYKTSSRYPVAEALSVKGINLPTFTSLRDEQIERICSLISSAI